MVEWLIILIVSLLYLHLWIPLVLLLSITISQLNKKKKFSLFIFSLYALILVHAAESTGNNTLDLVIILLVPSWFLLINILKENTIKMENISYVLLAVATSLLGLIIKLLWFLGIFFLTFLEIDDIFINRTIKYNYIIIAVPSSILTLYFTIYPLRNDLTDASAIVGVTLLLLSLGYWKGRADVSPADI